MRITLLRPVLILGSFFFSFSLKAEADRVIFTRAFADDVYGYYHLEVLRRALAVTEELGTAIAIPHPQPMPQTRQILKLQAGEGDVMWSATTTERENKLLPVHFPLLQGLSGNRVLIINAFKQSNFPATMSREELQLKIGIQGNDWPDLEILRHNNFTVEGSQWSVWFRTMFTAVEKGMVDYFPRNVIEVSNDLQRHKNKHVKLEDNFILRYPSYEIFLVSPHKPELVYRLQLGLLRMLESGELNELFEKHENHRLAMKIATDPNRTILELDNPLLHYKFNNALWSKDPRELIESLTKAIDEYKTNQK